MVDREQLDVVIERVERRRRDDPRLSHRAAEEELLPPGDLHQVGRPGEDGTERAAKPLGEAERDGVDARSDLGRRNAESDRGVHHPRPVHVHADAGLPRDGDDGVELCERPDPSARDVVGVLDDEHGGALVDDVLGGRARRVHLRCREPAAAARQADGEEPGVGGGAAELVDEHVRVLLRDEHVARTAVQLEGDLVGHRGGRQEEGALLAEQLGDAFLQLVDRRVFLHLLVADDRCRDGGAHPRRRARDGVGAKIDHGRPFCTCGETGGTFEP